MKESYANLCNLVVTFGVWGGFVSSVVQKSVLGDGF